MLQKLDKLAEKLTLAIGTPLSILIHTVLFIGIFALEFFGYSIDQILLILTTAVSLEAIYLAIFIQITVNRTTQSITGVEADIDSIEKDVDDIQEDVDEIQEDVQEITLEYAGDEQEEDNLLKNIERIETMLVTMHNEIMEMRKNRKVS